MNPFGNKFDLLKAKQFLEYAIFFTPQYGDSFIEALRLYTILGEREQIKQLKAVTLLSIWSVNVMFILKENNYFPT